MLDPLKGIVTRQVMGALSTMELDFENKVWVEGDPAKGQIDLVIRRPRMPDRSFAVKVTATRVQGRR